MLRRLIGLLLLVVAVLGVAVPHALASTTPNPASDYALVLNSWPVIMAAVVGYLATNATEILTHYHASHKLKAAVNFALSALGGVLLTVETTPGKTWKDYVALILAAWVVSMVTHATGATDWLQTRTRSFGVGARPLRT